MGKNYSALSKVLLIMLVEQRISLVFITVSLD